MIDLPVYPIVNHQVGIIDPSGTADAPLGSATDYLQRPGYRYSIAYELPFLRASDQARIFESRLEQAQSTNDDVSYPWPLDFKPDATVWEPWGAPGPLINGTSPAGAVIPLKALPPYYRLKEGQPMAVIHAGVGFIHKVRVPIIAAADGTVIVEIYPLTRQTFTDSDTVEIERPRLRGAVSWDGRNQGSLGRVPFKFTITERR